MSYETFDFGPWRLEVDVEATRAAYAEIAQGGADHCTCFDCQNFAAAREQACSDELREFLSSLGIDWRKESEASELGDIQPSGACFYMWWYHALGRVDGACDEDARLKFASPFGPSIEVAPDAYAPPPPSQLRTALPSFALVVYGYSPWVIDLPPP